MDSRTEQRPPPRGLPWVWHGFIVSRRIRHVGLTASVLKIADSVVPRDGFGYGEAIFTGEPVIHSRLCGVSSAATLLQNEELSTGDLHPTPARVYAN